MTKFWRFIFTNWLIVMFYHPFTCAFGPNEVCYSPLGCFSSDPPFGVTPPRPISSTPKSPDAIRTIFKLYSREYKDKSEDLEAIQSDKVGEVWRSFQVNPVKIIVHGFSENVTLDPWMTALKNEMLVYDNYNVIIVDWSVGAVSPYFQATENARVVGAQIAYLIQRLVDGFKMSTSDFHIIGHSLGCHVSGYAGERVPGIGRITGLDPAGPFFENTDPRIRLDPSDALFVDVIHTDGKPLIFFGLGTLQAMGHDDFYPNLGHDMPGCVRNLLTDISELGFRTGVKETFGCSHMRSITYFTESVNSKCPYTAYPCNSEADFVSGKCKHCEIQECVRMGFHARPSKGPIRTFYLTTAGAKPYCEYHYEISIKLSYSPPFSEYGNFIAYVTGSTGVTKSVKSSDILVTMKNDETIKYSITNPSDIGDIQSVTLRWEREDDTLASRLWNFFWRIAHKVYVNKVTIFESEKNHSVSFCAQDQHMENQQVLLMDKKC